MQDRSIRSYRHLEHQNPFSISEGARCEKISSYNFGHQEELVPLANDPIILSRLIQLFKHLKHHYLSTGVGFIHSSGIIFLVPFLVTKEALVPHANDPIMLERSIQSFRHLEHQNISMNSNSIGSTRQLKKQENNQEKEEEQE